MKAHCTRALVGPRIGIAINKVSAKARIRRGFHGVADYHPPICYTVAAKMPRGDAPSSATGEAARPPPEIRYTSIGRATGAPRGLLNFQRADRTGDTCTRCEALRCACAFFPRYTRVRCAARSGMPPVCVLEGRLIQCASVMTYF